MTRIGVAAVALGWMVACSSSTESLKTDAGVDAGPDSQVTYSYPGCEDAGTTGCPNDRVLSCARAKILPRHVACSRDSDCTLVTVAPDCVGIWSCQPDAVSVSGRPAFLTEMSAETQRYCGNAHCQVVPECANPGGIFVARCVGGQCAVQVEPDGGADAGTGGGAPDAGAADSGM